MSCSPTRQTATASHLKLNPSSAGLQTPQISTTILVKTLSGPDAGLAQIQRCFRDLHEHWTGPPGTSSWHSEPQRRLVLQRPAGPHPLTLIIFTYPCVVWAKARGEGGICPQEAHLRLLGRGLNSWPRPGSTFRAGILGAGTFGTEGAHSGWHIN